MSLRPFPRFGSRLRKGLLLLLASAAVAPTTIAASSQSAIRKHDSPAVPRIDWTDCGDGLQCASADVPLDYDRPDGRQISLALARIPATDPAHRLGSVFVNNGGPGNSVLDFVRTDARSILSADVQARFDIVGFDPHGVGRSTPIRCFTDDSEQQEFFGSLPAFPVTADEITQAATASQSLGHLCQQRNGELLEHVSTANVARDMDLLRRAVGDSKLTFAGYSYGGLLGMTYAKLFPGKVRALLLDGAPDPVAWATGTKGDHRPFSVRVDSARATGDALGFFLEQCQARPSGCAFASSDTRGKFDTLMTRLLQSPITVDLPPGPFGPGGPATITYAFLVDGLRGALQFPPIWSDLAELYQATFTAGETPASAPVADGTPKTLAGAGDDGYDNSHEALLSVACSETDNPRAASRWTQEAAAADRVDPFFGADWTWLSLPCATWPARDDDRATGPFGVATANPVLFVNARFDAASPYERAVRVAKTFPGSRLLTLEGAAHPASFVTNECVASTVGRYLVQRELPAKGAICQSEFVPFGENSD